MADRPWFWARMEVWLLVRAVDDNHSAIVLRRIAVLRT